jgi:hypothetical protein
MESDGIEDAGGGCRFPPPKVRPGEAASRYGRLGLSGKPLQRDKEKMLDATFRKWLIPVQTEAGEASM